MSPGTFTQYTLSRPEGNRTYYEYVPIGLLNPCPVVIGMHGSGGSSNSFIGVGVTDITGWDNEADLGHFLLLAMDGMVKPSTGKTGWNTDNNPLDTMDDGASIMAMLTDAKTRHTTDDTKVYISGFSNGAGATYMLAARYSDKIAAVSMASGDYTTQALTAWGSIPRLMPALKSHSVDDPIWKYPGFHQASPAVDFVNIDQCNSSWINWMGLNPAPTVGGTVTSTTAGDGTATLYTWTRSDLKCEQQFYKGAVWGHQWMGGTKVIVGGPIFPDISFTHMSWLFFQRWIRGGSDPIVPHPPSRVPDLNPRGRFTRLLAGTRVQYPRRLPA